MCTLNLLLWWIHSMEMYEMFLNLWKYFFMLEYVVNFMLVIPLNFMSVIILIVGSKVYESYIICIHAKIKWLQLTKLTKVTYCIWIYQDYGFVVYFWCTMLTLQILHINMITLLFSMNHTIDVKRTLQVLMCN